MTISQVQQYQRNRITSGQKSSAVGKYQFIQSTLSETVERAGFNPDTTYFTPEVQDQLMTTRLDQRGLSIWKKGNMDNNTFQDNLAKEFASVPVATSQQGAHGAILPGQSYYEGDGINSAKHVNATKFGNSLSQINNESGTQFVSDSQPDGLFVGPDAPSGDLTDREYIPFSPIITPKDAAILGNQIAEQGLDGAAFAELKNGYYESFEKHFENNTTISKAQELKSSKIIDQAKSLSNSSDPAESAQGLAIIEAAEQWAADNDIQLNAIDEASKRLEQARQQFSDPKLGDFDQFYNRSFVKKGPEPNWYTSVDLPTYNWTFYLTNKEVFDDPESFLNNSEPDPSKAIIIAKSGVEATYTIDNFLFNAILFGDDTKGSAQTSTMQFELKEPMGFTLLDGILSKAGTFNFKTMKDATYVLKLEFKGREWKTGRLQKYDGIHFFPVVPYGVTSETGPEGTSYMFTCLTIPSLAAIENTTSAGEVHVKAVATLGEFADKLEIGLNEVEKSAINPPQPGDNIEPTIEPRKTWQIRFDNTSQQDNFDLEEMPITFQNSSGTAKNTQDADKIDVRIPHNSNVISFVKTFITRQLAWNEYVKKAQDEGYTTPTIEITQEVVGTEGRKDEPDNITQQKPITTIITVGIKHRYGVVKTDGSDNEKLSDKNYQQTRFSKLPIVKKYDYLYTGKNTEVLNYSAQFNMLFSISTDPRLAFNTSNNQIEKPGTNLNRPVFLSDIPVNTNALNVMENLPRDYIVNTPIDQQLTEETITTNQREAAYAESYANRTADTQIIEVDVIGDPYLLGVPGATFTGKESNTLKNISATSDIFVAFVSYFPLNKKTLDNAFDKGPMDLYTSGVYELREIEHRFQQGQYVTKLRMYRDHKSSTYFLQEELKNL
tara:strand:- start:532 stop:3201 length:2670 start_codon:yes stop_codon:yes gene_type:complete